MAYDTQTYRKKSDHRNYKPIANGLKRHNGSSSSASRRRLLQILSGIVIGFVLGHIGTTGKLSSQWSWSKCEGSSAIDDDVSLLWRNDYPEEPPNIASEEPTASNSSAGLSLLFVGVMTAQKYLDNRAVAVYRTWGKELPGKIAFFSSGFSTRPKNGLDLPLVPLKGVDDSYPPQKKSFMMLQYMWDHFGDKFEWFMRADDDVYVRPDKIELFLRSVDSSKSYFIGQAGRGNQEEFGLLSLEYDENFCMGGPGIIMSRETLRNVALNVKYCLRHLYTTHEDVELGRCVQKFAKISCTWSYEMQSIFYHNSSGYKAFTGNLKQKEVHRAITLHPVKQHEHMYRMHNYMRGLKIHDLQQKKLSLHRDLYLMNRLLQLPIVATTSVAAFNKSLSAMKPQKPMSELDTSLENEYDMYETSLFGLQPGLNKFHPREESDVFVWDMISRSIFSASSVNPRRRIESYLREGLEDVVREVMDNINTYSRERGRVIEFQQILYGYYRVNPLYGPDYILDILLTYKKYRGRKMTVPVRRHAYVQQQFTGLEMREVAEGEEVHHWVGEENGKALEDSFSEDGRKFDRHLPMMFFIPHSSAQLTADKDNFSNGRKLINFILPLSGRYVAYSRFMRTFEEVCLRRNQYVALYVILFLDGESNELTKYAELISRLQSNYRSANIRLVPIYEKFSRASALEYGMDQVQMDQLLFFIDVDMVWTLRTLERIRMNTVIGKSVYFPIVFSQYDPSILYNSETAPDHFIINDESGYWRQFGFGIVSVYKQDVKYVGGFNKSIHGWGKEDVDFFEKLITQPSEVAIFRAVDPNLVHVFHIVECDPALDTARLIMCRNSRTDTYGSVNQLANLVYKNKHKLFEFASARNNRTTKLKR